MHLATLRKTCESNPLKLLKKYKSTKAAGSGGGSSSTSGGNKSTSKSTNKSSAGAEGVDEGEFRFDNLESVDTDRASATSSASAPAQGWTGIFGGGDGRASKFAAES